MTSDLTGQRFGLLLVTGRGPDDKWACVCDCGGKSLTRRSHLLYGHTKSCGCRGSHGHAKGYKESRTYQSWQAMHDRCRRNKHQAFHRYGGRGIRVCDRWSDFAAFLADMGERPPGTSLDRINNAGGYEPGNCRWATPREQAENRRTAKLVTFRGVRAFVADHARAFGMRHSTVRMRMSKGWTLEEALTIPVARAGSGKHGTGGATP